MENITFSYFKDSKIQTTTFQDLFSNKRVLICSLTRAWESVSMQYVGYVESLLPFYKQHGIDEVYFVISTQGNFFLAEYATKKENNAIPVFYNNKTFVDYVSKLRNKTGRDLNFLSKFWNFQALFNNGDLEHFSESSTSNPYKEAAMADPLVFKELIKPFNAQDPELFLWREGLVFTNAIAKPELYKLLFYTNLQPNKSLEKYLTA